ncbi:hypothetical protein QJQ45_006590 [Haematococcus lacustris]|nr:hypothetical protein QJQ45_006590 [Haematococcus lacustris]
MGRSRRDAHLHALNNSPRAGYLHCPSGLKAAARRANDIAQEVQAENELLMTEAELHQAIEERLPELRKEVRREEAAAAMARRIAKAEMKAAAATHRVGQVVVDVGDHEGQHRLSAAYALTYDGRDYIHTTVEEAEKLSVRELQAYLRFHQQELMKGWLKPKLKGLVMAHICNTVAALHGDELEAATGWKPPAGQVEQRLVRPAWSQERGQPVRGLVWCPVVAPRRPPQAPRSGQAATQPASSEPGPSTPQPAKRSKRTKAEPGAAEPTKGKGWTGTAMQH